MKDVTAALLDADRFKGLVPTPWCVEHKAEMVDTEIVDGSDGRYCWVGYYLCGDPAVGTLGCRLEVPPLHYRIEETP